MARRRVLLDVALSEMLPRQFAPRIAAFFTLVGLLKYGLVLAAFLLVT